MFGESKGKGAGIAGVSTTGIGVFGRGGQLAGRFEGDVEVTGDIRLANADCAEDFDIAGTEQIEPGTVMVLNRKDLRLIDSFTPSNWQALNAKDLDLGSASPVIFPTAENGSSVLPNAN